MGMGNLLFKDWIASGTNLFFDQSPPPITFPALAVAIDNKFLEEEQKLDLQLDTANSTAALLAL